MKTRTSQAIRVWCEYYTRFKGDAHLSCAILKIEVSFYFCLGYFKIG